jgi:hypothetical protein
MLEKERCPICGLQKSRWQISIRLFDKRRLLKNIELVNVFWDVSSGSHFNRKVWEELEAYLSNNLGRVQLLISVDASRIGRNFALFASEEQRFKEQYDVDFCFCVGSSEFRDLATEQFLRVCNQPPKSN